MEFINLDLQINEYMIKQKYNNIEFGTQYANYCKNIISENNTLHKLKNY